MATTRKVVAVTGCTRGLGRALATEFARLGHAVAGCGRSTEHVAELLAALPGHRFAAVDVRDAAAVQAWADDVVAILGVPDLVVLNAGVINTPAPLWEVGADEFGAVVDTNVKGVANGVRAFVPQLVKRGSGVVVALSSGWGRSTSAGVAPYCATKFAVEGLMKALADDLPKGLAAVPVSPGVVDTDMLRTSWGAGADRYPKPDPWAKRAAPFLLALGPKDSGHSLTTD